jgi:hypothetical protein
LSRSVKRGEKREVGVVERKGRREGQRSGERALFVPVAPALSHAVTWTLAIRLLRPKPGGFCPGASAVTEEEGEEEEGERPL